MLIYKKKPMPSFADQQAKIYNGINIKEITFQVTEDCCLNCTYCYQHCKSNKKMTFKTAKKFIDDLLNDKIIDFTTKNTDGIVFDFIGGEPLLEIKLIKEIWEYILEQLIKLNHPWKKHLRGSLCSNGILYFQPEVQEFLNLYSSMFSFTISIDGNKELHDSCRIDFNGNGSYDRAIEAMQHYRQNYEDVLNSKMTLAPENIHATYDAVINLIELGYTEIWLNCVYEEGWNWDHAHILYKQMIKIADYIIDNNLNDKIYISLFEEDYFRPMDEDDNENWCGGVKNKMLALNPDGEYYECIRYMKSSLNGKQKPLILGTVDEGFLSKEEYLENNKETMGITRRSQSTDECFYCPIATGCAWCSAYNYEETGSANKRLTYICPMHKARALANVYYWNKIYQKYNINKIFTNYLNQEDIRKILKEEGD